MAVENKQQANGKTDHAAENLESVGQMIIGAVEQIGGILTGDPATRAEGEFNAEVGSLHQESNKVLTAVENDEKVNRENLIESGKDESGK